MKKFLSFIALALMFVIGANAQVLPTKFLDNISIMVKGGVNTPLTFKGMSEQFGLQVEKGINPWLSLAIDGDFYIHQPKTNPSTMFDGLTLNGLVKVNPLFKVNTGKFGWDVYSGLGWSHRTSEPLFNHMNFGNYVAGTDLKFGFNKSFALVLSPEVNWAMTEVGKLSKNQAMLEVNLGVVYRFKNHDGKRGFTKARLYNQAEIDELNARVNSLIENSNILVLENKQLQDSLANVPEPVVETVEVEVVTTLLPPIQFALNSAVITSHATIIAMAKSMNNSSYTLTGYASNEGTEEYNMNLSERRAQAVMEALINAGVSPEKLSVKGAGRTSKFSESNPELNRVVTIE